jgi:hypothetical protein
MSTNAKRSPHERMPNLCALNREHYMRTKFTWTRNRNLGFVDGRDGLLWIDADKSSSTSNLKLR